MKGKSVYKIPNGKLIKINLDYDDETNKITNICINGDFFAYPEEAIEIIEKELIHTNLIKEELEDKISFIIENKNFEFIGLNPEGLVEGIMMCIK